MAANIERDVQVNDEGHLLIGGCDAVALAREYGTPLYVLDEQRIREACRAYREALQTVYPQGRILYAGKAFLTMGMCRIIAEEGLGLDVVSGGELYTALQAGFPVERMYFHGNNKSDEELAMAVDAGVGRIIVDNVGELARLEKAARRAGRAVDILLRLTPGVEADTHSYVQTGQLDSKFGIPMANGEALAAAKQAAASPWLRLQGYHCHLGSQIADLAPYDVAVDLMVQFLAQAQHETGVAARELNMGGGLAIRYYDETDIPTPAEFVARIGERVLEAVERENVPVPALLLEPGRSIVGPAGTTLYTVGFLKRIKGVRTYAMIDGGMGDNPRVALYQARHRAVVANKALEPPSAEPVTVAGKYCESGDILIENLYVPALSPGDVLAVSETGAYNYSMASNYNRLPRAAVVLVRDGRHELLVRRETYADVIRNDCVPSWLEGRIEAEANTSTARGPSEC